MTDDSTDNGESTVESLAAAVSGDEPNGDDGSLREDVRAIATIVREAEEIIDAIDVSELPDAVDGDQVREAIEVGEIPDALRDDENAEIVKLRQVIRAIDLGKTLASMDLTDVWESKRSIDDATDALEDDDEGGLFGDEGLIAGGEDSLLGEGDDGLLGGGEGEGLLGDDADGGLAEDLFDTDLDHAMDAAAEELKGDIDIQSGDMSAYQEVIQQQAMVGVDAFREALLKTHGQFERIVETNREKMRQQDRQPSSRNPTAVSTVASSRSDVSSVPNYATMPRNVRHSNAPTRSHIYGDRFRREREKRGYE